MTKKMHIYIKLLTSSFYLSAFTFGGGFVIIPLMKKKFVDDLHWIEDREMLNLAAIAQSSPGAVAINAAILLGYRVKGIAGALATILGTVLPPFITITVISFFYTAFRDNIVVSSFLNGMQAGIAAVIADVVLKLGSDVLKEKNPVSVIIMVGAFIATYFLKVNVIYIILVCGFIGAVKIFLQRKRVQKDGDFQ